MSTHGQMHKMGSMHASKGKGFLILFAAGCMENWRWNGSKKHSPTVPEGSVPNDSDDGTDDGDKDGEHCERQAQQEPSGRHSGS